jgi:multimeric flavodoxin WrbA
MKIIAINGSPRKNWNTAILVKEAVNGMVSQGAETEFVNLYDLNFKGCVSCFSCKLAGGKSVGRCAQKDDLSPLLEKIHNCDGIIIGSPIYISEVSAGVRALMERLLFQYLTYKKEFVTFFTRRIRTGFIHTMNCGESLLEEIAYPMRFKSYEHIFDVVLGPAKTVISTETLQTDDYGKYSITAMDEAERKKRREEVFPRDRKNAYELGVWVAGGHA